MAFSPEAAGANADQVSRTGPDAVRTSGKGERSETGLRDVNVCIVRPGDLIAHRGYAALVTDTHGRIEGGGIKGFYLHRTRFLSRLALKVGDDDPRFVSANPVDHHVITSYHLAPSPAGSKAGATPDGDSSQGGEIVGNDTITCSFFAFFTTLFC